MIARLYYVRCDGCGAACGSTHDLAETTREARQTARRQGWRRVKGGVKTGADYCPTCVKLPDPAQREVAG